MFAPCLYSQGLPGTGWVFGAYEFKEQRVPLWTFLSFSCRTDSPGRKLEVLSLVNPAQIPTAVYVGAGRGGASMRLSGLGGDFLVSGAVLCEDWRLLHLASDALLEPSKLGESPPICEGDHMWTIGMELLVSVC